MHQTISIIILAAIIGFSLVLTHRSVKWIDRQVQKGIGWQDALARLFVKFVPLTLLMMGIAFFLGHFFIHDLFKQQRGVAINPIATTKNYTSNTFGLDEHVSKSSNILRRGDELCR